MKRLLNFGKDYTLGFVKELILVVILSFTLIGFGFCDYLISSDSFIRSYKQNLSVQLNSSNQWEYSLSDYGIYCNQGGDYSGDVAYYKSDGTFIGWLIPNACIYGGSNESYIYSNNHTNLNFYMIYMYLPGVIYTGSINCDVMTSNECQSNYNLMPISDVDQEYCLGNNLCPEIENGSGDCENESGDVQWSALYINDIQHLGKPLININIPDYIFWDYSTDDEEFNLYIGSGYDQEYIDNVISINSYRPDSQDFTDVFVGGFSLVMPYIVIVLFIIFVRKFIKRIFK